MVDILCVNYIEVSLQDWRRKAILMSVLDISCIVKIPFIRRMSL